MTFLFLVVSHHDICAHAVPTGAPQNVNVTIINSSALQVLWDAPVFEEQNGLIRFYQLLITEIERETQLSITVADELKAIVSDLHALYSYQVQVAASTVEIGPFSELVTWQLPEGCECKECTFGSLITYNVFLILFQLLVFLLEEFLPN